MSQWAEARKPSPDGRKPENADTAEEAYERGIAALNAKDYDRALSCFSEAIRLDPQNGSIYYDRGRVYGDKGEHDKAIADFTEAIRLDPKKANAYGNRGVGYTYKKEYDKALADFRQALRLDPKEPIACNGLARLLANCPKADVRDGKKAVEYARKACEMTDWKESAYLETLASAYAESGDFKQAVKWQKKALESSEKFSEKERNEMQARLKLYEQGKPYREK